MRNIETIIEKYKHSIEAINIGLKLYFVPSQLGQFKIYEGVVIGISLEYDESSAYADGFRVEIQIDLRDNCKHTISIVLRKSKKNSNQDITWYCGTAPIEFKYFREIEEARDYIIQRNEQYIKELLIERNNLGNKKFL